MTLLASSHLEANLAALSRTSPDAVARIRSAFPTPDIAFLDTQDGVPTAQIGSPQHSRLLASRRRPLEEAARLVDPVDIKSAAVFVVAGFGMGYHVQALLKRVARTGLVIVFEPDVSLLRAVLERVDCTRWIEGANVCILTDPEDGAAMGQTLRGLEGLVGLGVTLVRHPSSEPRLGTLTQAFHERFVGVVDSIKMTVLTTLVQSRVTIRNLLQNADVYATNATVGPLAGACAGRPAIVVSAGPSLQRNVDLLRDPAVRERCAIVAVQTVLRPLLAKGVRPHFVTALDYSEINRRFYEGLTPQDIDGITLVVEPKVNPAVPEAWQALGGRILCTTDNTLELLLGDGLAKRDPAAALKQGATVAHLAYYLARHLGCDPVALIGQDLGFTDGQYYAAGASIHNVWACEVNEFKSLELLEWQRIVRMGEHLRRTTDTLGRPVFTDSQMHSYLQQFETDFRDDVLKGHTIIDATEGGVRKQHAGPMPLRDFLEAYAPSAGGPGIDHLLAARLGARTPLTQTDRARVLKQVAARVAEARRQVGRVADVSRRTAVALAEMREHQQDQRRVDALIEKVHASAREVEKLAPGFALTQLLAQSTVLNRVRADRMIGLEQKLSGMERQKLQITRDIENVRGLEATAEELAGMLDDASASLKGRPRITRDMPKHESELALIPGDAPPPRPAARATTVCAVLPVHTACGSLGWRRSLDGPFAGRRSVLAATVHRLLACRELKDVVLSCTDADAVRALLDPVQRENARVRVESVACLPDTSRARAIAAGRLWARACWRGGLADLTVFDELFDPRATGASIDAIGADAALIVGPDWCAVDPALCDQVVRRHRENPDQYRLTFTQAAPGLCGCVVSKAFCNDLSPTDGSRSPFASIGGVLGYMPMAPLQDLIAHPVCVPVAGPARDCGLRLVADTPAMREILERALATGGGQPAPAQEIASRAAELARERPGDLVEELVITRPGTDIGGLIRQFLGSTPHGAITLGGHAEGSWQPLAHPDTLHWIQSARSTGAAGVHVRVSIEGCDDAALARLVASGAHVISIDCWTDRGLSAAEDRLNRLLDMRRNLVGHDGMDVPWIVPRLSRRDATYEHVEEFINRWIVRCGWAALDPLQTPRPGERIGPLPLPASAADRLARSRRIV